MGCTSSAPNMAAANATDKNITFLDDSDEKDTEKFNHMSDDVHQTKAIIENTVLPTCDTATLDKPFPLYQTEKSMSETTSRRIDKDVQTDSFRIDNGNSISESSQTLHENEEKTPKLEEVVEQVVEMLNSRNNNEVRSTPEPEAASEAAELGTDDACEHSMEADVEQDVVWEPLEAAISPSQSESSRATRWEALADVAAELPASLAVDPLTGQIYTLK